MLLVFGCPLFGAWIMPDAAGTAAEGNVAVSGNIASFHNRPINIGGVNARNVNAHHGRVVGEFMAAPHAAGKSDAAVAEAIVHAAVVANMASPVAVMKDKHAAGPAPVAGRPERSLIGGRNPRAGHPIVPILAVSPIARRPHPARFRARGLLVNREHRWRKSDTDEDSGKRARRDQTEKRRQQQPAHGAKQFHK